jgi:magnesium chelatase family protein
VDFPARFQLVGAMNPSPCGHYGDGQTRSSPDQILPTRFSRVKGRFQIILVDENLGF